MGQNVGEEYEGLRVEGRFTEKTIQKLKDSGHLVEVVGDYDPLMGHAAAIKVDEEGFLKAEPTRGETGRLLGFR